jgi:hypothetical protein
MLASVLIPVSNPELFMAIQLGQLPWEAPVIIGL